LQSHPIAAVLRVPIDILHAEAVGERAAQALPACELIEPLLERMIGVAAIRIARRNAVRNEHCHTQRYGSHCWTG
jgi:hypothetical protein